MARHRESSTVHNAVGPRNVRPIVVSAQDCEDWMALQGIGINFPLRAINEMIEGLGLDAADDVGLSPSPLAGLTTASITTPVQFLQNWLPGFVRVLTAARVIDDLIGIMTVGSWEDEEIVQGILEPQGTAQPYSDYGNIPLTSWNVNFVTRTVVRFEQGILVGLLEEARAARIRISTAQEKRGIAAVALDIQRNRVGFYGYNDGAGNTYGFLNDPNLPSYVTVATGVGGYLWSEKTFLEITADIRTWFAQLQIQALGKINVKKDPITMAIPLSIDQYLTVTNTIGDATVQDWFKRQYPNARIEVVPELDGANGGANACYLYAEKVDDGGSDGGATWVQVVPTKFYALGVEKRTKSYVEDYANGSAGTMLKRPYAVYRASGM